jgi:hypothetical protein
MTASNSQFICWNRQAQLRAHARLDFQHEVFIKLPIRNRCTHQLDNPNLSNYIAEDLLAKSLCGLLVLVYLLKFVLHISEA